MRKIRCDANQALDKNEEVHQETDKIKIFFLNRVSIAPVIGNYDILD